MRLVEGSQKSPDDRSTRARLRDIAIEVFARDGFGATVRTIAEAAEVSPGLVIHHFGSKTGLRTECDDHVLAMTQKVNRDKIDGAAGGRGWDGILAILDGVESEGPRIVYLIRSLQSGGEMARNLLDQLVADTNENLKAGVAEGTIRPSIDESARARYLVAQSLGAILVDLVMYPPDDWSDAGAILRDSIERTVIPATEYAVYGVMADDSLMTTVLNYRKDHDDPQG